MIWIIVTIAVISVWLGMGIIGEGYDLAYFQKAWPTLAVQEYERDAARARKCIFFGLASLIEGCTRFSQALWVYWMETTKAGE